MLAVFILTIFVKHAGQVLDPDIVCLFWIIRVGQ